MLGQGPQGLLQLRGGSQNPFSIGQPYQDSPSSDSWATGSPQQGHQQHLVPQLASYQEPQAMQAGGTSQLAGARQLSAASSLGSPRTSASGSLTMQPMAPQQLGQQQTGMYNSSLSQHQMHQPPQQQHPQSSGRPTLYLSSVPELGPAPHMANMSGSGASASGSRHATGSHHHAHADNDNPFFKPSFSDFIDAIPDVAGPHGIPLQLDNNNFSFAFPGAADLQPAGSGSLQQQHQHRGRPLLGQGPAVSMQPPVLPLQQHSALPTSPGARGGGFSLAPQASNGSLDFAGAPGGLEGQRATKSRRASYTSDHSGTLSPGLSPTSSLAHQFSADMTLRFTSPDSLGLDDHSDPDKRQTTRDKNREAQRRYREKQRSALNMLQSQTEDQQKVIAGLIREKRMVEEHNRVLLERVWQLESALEQATGVPSRIGAGQGHAGALGGMMGAGGAGSSSAGQGHHAQGVMPGGSPGNSGSV